MPVTLLKADISGSTPLAERLDPEELRGVLGAYFAALAREIQRHGGAVDKYIGDAVMAVFGLPEARPDDAARAIRAALAMQEAIAIENAALLARYSVALSLRIGVHTGELSVAEDAEVTLIGTPVAVVERVEAAAPLNGVLVSESTRSAAARRFRFKPASRIVMKQGGPPVMTYRVDAARTRAASGGAGSATAGASASLQVAGQQQHTLQEERKVVTVLFADVAIAEGQLLPDDVRPVMNAFFSDVTREIQHFGGTIDKYIGDAVMAVFGAPVSHDDDGVRAVSAALAIQAALRRRNDPLHRERGLRLAARIGVNTGEVVAGLLPGEIVAYTVTGDAVNTAQRIESAAPLGAILVSESTRALTRGAFRFEAVLPLQLKGKTEPVPAYLVLGSDTGIDQSLGPPLVGRADELAWLHQRFAQAAGSTPQIAHLHGEAGSGKSRITAEFVSTLPAATVVLRARANSYEAASPYAVIADLVRRLWGIASLDDEAVAGPAVLDGVRRFSRATRASAHGIFMEVLGYGERSQLGAEQKRRLLSSLVRQIFLSGGEATAVLLIEDVHWIDPTSAALLADVIGSLSSGRFMVITTARDATAPWRADGLALHSLGDLDAERLIDQVAGEPLDPAVRRVVMERTGGNPFFIEEVVRAIRIDGLAKVPATIQDVLEAALDRLEEVPRLVAQGASIIGRTFSRPLLERSLSRPDLDSALHALVAAKLLIPGGSGPEPTFMFAHALVQEVAYRTQLITRRRQAHAGVGDAITSLYAGRLDEFVDVLAYQYGRGDDDQKARVALVTAGRRAQHLYAKLEALNYFEQAIARAADDPDTRAAAAEAIGDVLRVTGDYLPALGRYEDASRVIGAEPGLAGARIKRKSAIVRQLQGDHVRAAAIYREVLAELPAEAHEERARALVNVADVAWRQGRYDEAHSQLEAAIAEAGNEGSIAAEAMKQLGTIYSHRGELERALLSFQQSLDAYESAGDVLGQANVQNNIGVLERQRGRHAAAVAAYGGSLTIRERIGDQLGQVHSHNNLGQIHYLQGDLPSAVSSFDAALAIARSIGYILGVGASLIGLGASRAEQGDADAARADLLAGVSEIERSGSLPNLVDALCDLSNAYSLERSPEATVVAERALTVARELRLPERTGIALQALGRAHLVTGDLPGALAVLEESRAILEPLAEPQELARTLSLLGQAYGADPDRRREADELTGRARKIFTGLGAALDLRRMDQPPAD